MQKKQKTLALAGAGIAAAAALGLTGASLANAAEETGSSVRSTATPSPGSSSGTLPEGAEGSGRQGGGPGAGHGMRDGGGTLTADAASKAVAAAQAEVDGGTVSGVRATSNGTYVVDVTKSDDTHVHVLLDAEFGVTSVEEGGMGGRGRPHGEVPDGSTGSTDPEDANGTTSGTSTSLPST